MTVRAWAILMTHILHFVLLLQFITSSPSVPVLTVHHGWARERQDSFISAMASGLSRPLHSVLSLSHEFSPVQKPQWIFWGCSVFSFDQDKGMSQWGLEGGCYYCCCLVSKSCPTLLRPHRLWPTKLHCLWDFPGKNTGVGCHFLLQRIFQTQRSNSHLLHWLVGSLPLKPQGNPLREETPANWCELLINFEGIVINIGNYE